ERLGVRFPGPTRRQRATAVPTATPSHAKSKHQKPGGSSRSPRWAGSIIATNVARLELRTAVELSHRNKVLYCRFIGRPFSPTRSQRSRRRRMTPAAPPQRTNHRFSTVPVSLRVFYRKTGSSCGRALSDRVSEKDRLAYSSNAAGAYEV